MLNRSRRPRASTQRRITHVGKRSEEQLRIRVQFEQRPVSGDVQPLVHFAFMRDDTAVETQPLLENRNLKNTPELLQILVGQLACLMAGKRNDEVLERLHLVITSLHGQRDLPQ